MIAVILMRPGKAQSYPTGQSPELPDLHLRGSIVLSSEHRIVQNDRCYPYEAGQSPKLPDVRLRGTVILSSEHRIVQNDRCYILGEQDSTGEILLAMAQWSDALLR